MFSVSRIQLTRNVCFTIHLSLPVGNIPEQIQGSHWPELGDMGVILVSRGKVPLAVSTW